MVQRRVVCGGAEDVHGGEDADAEHVRGENQRTCHSS